MESIISVALSSEENPLVNLLQSKEHEGTNLQLNAFFRHFFLLPLLPAGSGSYETTTLEPQTLVTSVLKALKATTR